MPWTYENLIGNTPLVELKNSSPMDNIKLFAKLEMYNPTRSIKDRIALHIINEAEREGKLKPGMTIIEATSGNTGASLALVGVARGYRVCVTTPDKTSFEKIKLMQAYGAEVTICKGKTHDEPDHYTSVATALHQQTAHSYMIDQYNNPANIAAHYLTTGPEIWQQMRGEIDYVIVCASSGGTATGVARYLKEKNNAIKIIVPDPVGSVYYDYFKTGKLPEMPRPTYLTQGAGKDYLCSCMDFSVIDEIVQFTDNQMFTGVSTLIQRERLLVGETAGAVYYVATELASKLSKKSANIVMIFPDAGEKYLQTYGQNFLAPS